MLIYRNKLIDQAMFMFMYEIETNQSTVRSTIPINTLKKTIINESIKF